MKTLLNRKGSDTVWNTVIIVVILIVFAFVVLYFISDNVHGAINDLLGIGTSDESLGKFNCDKACNDAKTLSKDCGNDWKTLYCNQPYNDTITCAQAQGTKYNLISSCTHKINDQPCPC